MGNENSKKNDLSDRCSRISTENNVTSQKVVSAVVMQDCTVKSPEDVDVMRNALADARNMMIEKDKTIEELQREIDKLRSVLDQTHSNIFDQDTETTNKLRSKRLAVSGESPSNEPKQDIVKCPKSTEVKKVIRDALMGNMLLSKLDAGQINEMIDCMYEVHVLENCYVIREGDEGERLHVAQDGEFEVYKDGKLLSKMGSNICFGELALLYNCKRTASVKALKTTTLWVLERNIFQAIMMKTSLEQHQDLRAFLQSVPLFKDLSERKWVKIVELIERQTYADGQCIIRQGELANSFFIIRSGWVRVTQKLGNKEIDVRLMTIGDYFGEKALLEGGKRTANIYATKGDTEVLCIYRQGFTELVGELNDIHKREYHDEERAQVHSLHTSVTQGESELISLNEIRLNELEIIGTVGVGGFGRVELVVRRDEPTASYALKIMKKEYIVRTKQQNHVLSEKNILAECRSPFICRLYGTFRDAKYIYLLTEICLGGEVWTFLRDKIHFNDSIAVFVLACAIEAIHYLHYRGIVYRDLKPENLLIGHSGYVKLCDFGFAKKIGVGMRTWTFCGTPEYVAPEIILNKGHDFSVDYWSIGILTFELLNGSPPFISNDAMKIYNMTLQGIQSANILHNRKISAKASCFIHKLCRFSPIERLGNGVNGIEDIRAHKYFQGFDWDGVKSLSMKSPFAPKIASNIDTSNFDKFSDDPEVPPDELSGWDYAF